MKTQWKSMAPINLDHPNLSNSLRCPLCGGLKGVGPVVCWPCYRYHELKYGNATAMDMIDSAERRLESGKSQ